LICSNFPLFSSLRQKQLNVSLIDFFLFLFFSFSYATDIFWTVTKWNNYFFVFWYATKSRRRRNLIPRNFCGINKKQKFQKDITWLMKPSSDTKWCEPRDHVVTQPTIKIEIWSRKTEIGLIGVWHNGNLPQGTNTIGLSRMTSRSQLIFNKSDSVRSRTEERKNHSRTLKLKNSEVIIIKVAEILANMSLNSSWKVNPNGPLMWT